MNGKIRTELEAKGGATFAIRIGKLTDILFAS